MPINLAGGYGAGGVHDALLEIVKQRLLEQELAQRADEQQFQRLRQQKQDDRASEQETYNRSRDTAGDLRQKELDRIAEETRTQQNQVAKFNVLKGMPNADITASLGEDPTTAHAIPTQTPSNLPSGAGQSYRLPTVPMQPNRMDVGGIKIRPPSAEVLNEEAATDEERKTQNAIRIAEATRAPRVTSLQHVEGGTFNPETGEYKQATGWTPPKSGGSGGQLTTNQELLAVDRLSKAYDKARAPIVEMQRQVGNMHEGLAAAKAGDLAAGSQAVLVTFQKILDPNSVVRESEYMRSAAGQSLLNRMAGAVEQLSKGGTGVPYEQLVKFAALAETMANTENKYVEGVRRRLEATAKQFNIKPELIFSDFGDNAPAGGGTGGAAAPGNVTVTRGPDGKLIVKR